MALLNANFPGVYPSITDLSQVVNANSVTSCAYVGEAEFGPINTPTLITNKKGYIDRFGEIKSKYGYMGYSLAVASDSIGQHYVVRVVNEETARYGLAAIPLYGKFDWTGTQEQYDDQNIAVLHPEWNCYITDKEASGEVDGYTISNIKMADKDSGALFVTENGDEIVYDTDSAFRVVSNNPNNKDIRVAISDSTINTNKQYKSLKTTQVETEEVGQYKVRVTISEEGKIEKGDTIFVTCPDWNTTDQTTGNEIVYNKKFTVSGIEKTYYYTGVPEDKGQNYHVGDKLVLLGATLDTTQEQLQVEVTKVNDQGGVEEVVPLTGSDYNKLVPPSESGEEQKTAFDTVTTSTGTGCSIKIINKEKQDVVAYIDTELHDNIGDANLSILKYPELSETTFSVRVMEVKDKVVETVEQFNYVTLFENQDQYGNSTFIEDVINGRSTYIKVYANPYTEEANPIPAYDTYRVAHATSGNSPTMSELVKGWDLFKDRTQTTVTLLMNCGYINEAENSYQNAMLEVAEKRRDCFCLFDVPSTATESDAVLDWRKNSQGFNTYRGAVFTPWVKSYDSVNGKRNFNMCPSAYIAKIMGAAGKPWVAAAGPNRGYYTSSVVSPTGLTAYYDEETGGELYKNQLNCGIKDVAGYANWGQKTLQMKPSALDRINVARTVIYIETTLREAARYHLFENNTAFERMQITLQFNQFLDEVVNGGGLTRYEVICDDSNNTPYVIQNNQLVIDIYIWPVYTTEFIALNTIVMGADADISITSNQ